MNNNLSVILFSFLLVSTAACKKNNDIPASNVVYEETVSGIKKNEPVLLTFTNSNNTAKVSWTVTPLSGVSISAVGNNATFIFTAAGSYNVLATAGSVSAKYTVNVADSEYVNYGTTFNLSAAKLVNINKGEEVVFAVHNAQAGSNISWAVSNLTFPVSIDAADQTATVMFTSGGLCTITASDGIHTQRRTVWVNDTADANPNQDTVPFILGEKLNITPAVISIGGVKQLVMQAATTNTYHCPTDKILSFSQNSDYMIDYSGVVISPQPCTPAAIATCSNSFSNIAAGMHTFSINFGNKTYTGSLTVSSTGIHTFTWPDTSFVHISPLVVQ